MIKIKVCDDFVIILFMNKWVFVKPLTIFRALRRIFPTCYAIGLRDCDSGGQVTHWCYDVHYGILDQSFIKRWNGAGDGEVYQKISFLHYIKGKYAK